MATSYTSLLGLALPVTGELSGTWGDTVNDSITSLLDTAVAGTTTLSTDADVTLSTTTGVANQARQAIILWTANGTTTRNITAPAQSKIYTVINASAGTQSIVFRGAGPTAGVTIVKGESALVAWNGSDFIKISNTGGAASFTNVTVSGTTTLSGLTASTALALNASKEVVSVTNTGTGNNVLSASPTLTGTVAGASLQLSSLTSGRVTYAGASGLLQDSANLTFNGTDLTVSGAVNAGTINATTLDLTNLEVTNIKAKDGTAGMQIADSTGVVSFTANPVMSGGTANGVAYLNGSKVLTTGSALTFDGTGMTIGAAASASTRLTVNGPVQFNASTDTNTYVGLQNTAYLTASGSIVFGANSAEGMRLTSTGLGIGTSSPGYKLDVRGNVAGGNGTIATGLSWDTNGLVGTFTNHSLGIMTNSSVVARFDTSGNLGLGVTPSAWSSAYKMFQASSQASFGGNSSNITIVGSNYYNDGASKYIGTGLAALYLQDAGVHKWLNAPTGTAGNAISFSQVMTLDSSGNLGIGTSSPSARLTLQGSASSRLIQLYNGGSSADYSAIGAQYSGGSAFCASEVRFGNQDVGSGTGFLAFATGTNSATERARIDSAGNLGLGVTPSAWVGVVGLQLAASGKIASSNGVFEVGSNFYFDNGTYRRISTNAVSLYGASNGTHAWYTAGSDTAGNAISFTQALTLDANGKLLVGLTSSTSTNANIQTNKPINLAGYTVAGLPTGSVGDIAYVTDALAPTFLATIVGGGSIKTPVFYNGTNWVAY